MSANSRIRSIDILRGVVMVLMAIDHVRVYSGLPPGGPTAGIFFTRWMTHFCAPWFAFLAGTGAFLYGRKLGDLGALARGLVTRGLMLVLLELTVIRFSWTFNVAYSQFVLAGVIWMLGWSMVLLAGLVRLRTRTIGIIGICLMLFQQIFGLLPRLLPPGIRDAIAPIWNFFYPSGAPGWQAISILYVIVPWLGVMAAGYAFGAVITLEPARRNRICVMLGASAIALFLLLRTVDVYGNPRHWHVTEPSEIPALFRFINTNKYPASLQFLLMTLGPTILLLPLADRARGKIGELFATFGRVPMFYYLIHIPTIHLAAVIISVVREGKVEPWLFANHPTMVPASPEGYMWSLALLYAVFFVVIAVLYFPCRWYARRKATNPAPWMRYI